MLFLLFFDDNRVTLKTSIKSGGFDMNKDPQQKQPSQNNHNGTKKQDNELDEASKESFPASDAPAWVSHDKPPKKPPKSN
jgi:hypothetical protein